MHHLYGGTDAATMVLFDPAALRTVLEDTSVIGYEELEAAAADGNLVHWYTAADGSFWLRAYVDEPVPASLAARAVNGVRDKLLRVPSGRLVFAGADMLKENEAAWSVANASIELPPGDYVFDAFEVDWTQRDDQDFQRAWEQESGTFGVRVVTALEGLTILVLLATLGCLIPAVVMVVMKPAVFLQGLIRLGPWFAGAWAVLLIGWRLPPVRRIQQVRKRLERERPDAVVHLRRLDASSPRPEGGGSFGVGMAGGD